MRWITVGPAGQPGTSILLAPPATDPGITDDERRTIAEMMAKGTYGWILLATKDLDGTFERLQASDAEVVQEPVRAALRRSRLRLPRSRGQPDPHPGAALSRPVIAAMCTDAYREALTRDLSSTASPAPGQRQAGDAGRESVARRPLRRRTNPRQDDLESRGVAAAGAVAESSPAMTLAKDATVVHGEAIDQR